MKKFLFLYPIRPYFQTVIGGHSGESVVLEGLNSIINIRYRKKGYVINWLFFGQEDDPDSPDISIHDPRIKIDPSDIFLSSGVSFKKHCDNLVYPACEKILLKISNSTEIVVGGFHQADCVDKIARTAHNLGIKVSVDEDTTDQLFQTFILLGLPPIERTPEQYAEDLRKMINDFGVKMPLLKKRAFELHREERSVRPWLVPI